MEQAPTRTTAPTITVATINLFGWHKRPSERFSWLAAGLAAALPDIVLLQEVSLDHQAGERLVAALNAEAGARERMLHYHGIYQPHQRNTDLSVGILTHLPVLDRYWLDLQGQGRVALGITTEVGGVALGAVSTHLFWEIGAVGDVARAWQAARLRDWVAATLPTPTVVGGDFNATPSSRTYELLRERWLSLHAARHGAEPAWTCATPLAPTPENWQGTLDYLFLAPSTAPVRVLNADVFLDQPAPSDPLLFPSDHLGVLATVALGALGRLTER